MAGNLISRDIYKKYILLKKKHATRWMNLTSPPVRPGARSYSPLSYDHPDYKGFEHESDLGVDRAT